VPLAHKEARRFIRRNRAPCFARQNASLVGASRRPHVGMEHPCRFSLSRYPL